MIKHLIKPQDDRYLFLYGDEEEMKKLTEYLNKIPQFQFLPSYSGIPKPEVHLSFFKNNKGQKIYYCFSGLYLDPWAITVVKKFHGIIATIKKIK